MKIYKEEYTKYTKMQNVQEERVDSEQIDIILKYEKEKEYLDKLLKQFMDLINRFKEYEKNNEISEEIIKEKEKFEDDFVRLNCEIQ